MGFKNYCARKVLNLLLQCEFRTTHTLEQFEDDKKQTITTDNVNLEKDVNFPNGLKMTLTLNGRTWNFNPYDCDMFVFETACQQYGKNKDRVQKQKKKTEQRIARLREFRDQKNLKPSDFIEFQNLIKQEIKCAKAVQHENENKYTTDNLSVNFIGYMHENDEFHVSVNGEKKCVCCSEPLLYGMFKYLVDNTYSKRKRVDAIKNLRLSLMQKALSNIK